MERLQKVLAHAGVASRRECEELIKNGKVKVNGKTVTELGTKVDERKDKIEVNGKKIEEKEKHIYILLNKPKGFVTTMKDPQGRKKVTDLLEGIEERVYPVGRLDYDTEGLLLLTNDGELTFTLTHPKHKVEKTYLARVQGFPNNEKLGQLHRGVQLDDGMTAPAKVRLLSRSKTSSLIEIKIHEGRNKQIRRMFEVIGNPVIDLQRTQLAFLNLSGISVGSYRYLTDMEVRKLKNVINEKPKELVNSNKRIQIKGRAKTNIKR